MQKDDNPVSISPRVVDLNDGFIRLFVPETVNLLPKWIDKESENRCKNPSTVHSDGPPSLSGKDKSILPSLFPGTRPFLFVTAVAGGTTTCPLPLFFLFHLFYNHIQLSWKGT